METSTEIGWTCSAFKQYQIYEKIFDDVVMYSNYFAAEIVKSLSLSFFSDQKEDSSTTYGEQIPKDVFCVIVLWESIKIFQK